MMNKEVKNIYGGVLDGRDVIWDDDKEVFICKKELEQGEGCVTDGRGERVFLRF